MQPGVLKFRRQEAIYRHALVIDLREFLGAKGDKVPGGSVWQRSDRFGVLGLQREIKVDPLRHQIRPDGAHSFAEEPKEPRLRRYSETLLKNRVCSSIVPIQLVGQPHQRGDDGGPSPMFADGLLCGELTAVFRNVLTARVAHSFQATPSRSPHVPYVGARGRCRDIESTFCQKKARMDQGI